MNEIIKYLVTQTYFDLIHFNTLNRNTHMFSVYPTEAEICFHSLCKQVFFQY